MKYSFDISTDYNQLSTMILAIGYILLYIFIPVIGILFLLGGLDFENTVIVYLMIISINIITILLSSDSRLQDIPGDFAIAWYDKDGDRVNRHGEKISDE
jgi:hypothetical protein